MKKKISVVMCTYNGAPYIKEQLDSIVQQTCPVAEIIIQDDGSDDNTFAILQEYQKLYPHIHVFKNENKKGVNDNFFSAMQRATSEYIAIADQDDVWELNKIEQQMGAIGDDWLCACYSVPFSDGSPLPGPHAVRIKPNYAIERMLYTAAFPGHTMVIAKNLINKIPDISRFSPLFTYDLLLQIVAAAYNKIVFCAGTAVYHRRHLQAASYTTPENYSKSLPNMLRYTLRTFRLYKEIRPYLVKRLNDVRELLSLLPENAATTNAMKLAAVQAKGGFFNFCKTMYYTVKYRHRLFYKQEPNPVLAVIRGLYFPISGVDYFRYRSRAYKRVIKEKQGL